MSFPLAAKGAATTFAGGTTAILGSMAGLTANEWGVLGLSVALSLFSGNLAALAIQHQGRNALNPGTPRNVGVIFGVQLYKPHLALQRLRGLGKFRGHHPAGATPRRPIVNEQRQLIAPHGLVMAPRIQFGHLAIRQRITAGAAFRPIGQLGQRHAIHLATGDTGQFDGIAHGTPHIPIIE